MCLSPGADSLQLDEFELINSTTDGKEAMEEATAVMESDDAFFKTDAWVNDASKMEEVSADKALSWGTAVDEKEAKVSRELDRKAEEERLIEQRSRAEAERLAVLRRESDRQEEERLGAIAEEERRKEEAARQALERREEEKRAREQMQQTVNLDQQHEALMMLDDI